MKEISAFNLAAVELRTDRHQHQENKADGQNYEAVDGLCPFLERQYSRRDLIRTVISAWTVSRSLSGASCLVEAEREASGAETDDQD